MALCEQRAGGASVARVWASIIACGLAIGSGRPATTSGVAIFMVGSAVPACRHAQVGEIRGYARRQPLPGWRKCPPLPFACGGGAGASLRPVMPLWCALLHSGASFGLGDGKGACLERRLGGKGIQGLCAPMAERCGGAMRLRLRPGAKKSPDSRCRRIQLYRNFQSF